MTQPERSGWFWEMAEGRRPPPPAAATLGFVLTSISPETGEVEGTFLAGPGFRNMMGGVQGGFLAAMLDTTLSCALIATLASGHFAPTLELKVNYLRPAPLGTLTGRGRLVHRGGTIAFMAGELLDGHGEVVTTATATARIVRPD
jgi:uncharacterized protein (TIGR00369 family)